MIKKAKYALFIAAATVFNMAVTIICFTILMLPYSVLLIPRISEKTAYAGVYLLLAAAIVFSFLIYRRALKLYLKKRPQDT